MTLDERTEQDWVLLSWMRKPNTTHKLSRATLNVHIPKNPCKGALLTGVTSTIRYCYQRPHGKEKLSVCRWSLLHCINSQKFHCPCYQHWDHLFISPPVPTLNFWSFQDRSKNFPRTIRTYRNVESRATSVISAKCGSPVKPVQEGGNGPVHSMPNLICLTLNSSTNKILILTFPGGFQPGMRGAGHTAPHIRTIFAAGKSKRQQILRENCLSSAHKILSSLWTFYCCLEVRNTH